MVTASLEEALKAAREKILELQSRAPIMTSAQDGSSEESAPAEPASGDEEDYLLMPDKLALALEEQKTPQIHHEEKEALRSSLDMARLEQGRLQEKLLLSEEQIRNDRNSQGMKMIKWNLAHRLQNDVRMAIEAWLKQIENLSQARVFEASKADEVAGFRQNVLFAHVMARWLDKATRERITAWRRAAASDGHNVGIRARFKRTAGRTPGR